MRNILISFFLMVLFQGFIIAQGYDELADAVYDKNLDKINDLLDSGVDINSTPEGMTSTVLFIACSMDGYEKVASLLVSRGAELNFAGDDGRTPLMWAAGNSLETTKLLLEHGADIKATAVDGMNAVIQATFGILSKSVTTDVIDVLLEHGADINGALTGKEAPGWTALLFASVNGNKDLVNYLILHGANVNHTSDEGITALSLAKQEKYSEIVTLLKKHGALE